MGFRLRVLTANLFKGRADPDDFAELVRRSEADVVAVQELWPEQADALSRVVPHGRLEPEEGFRGMGIALRHPASAFSRIPMACRDGRVARLDPTDWPGLPHAVEIVNVHLAAPHAYPGLCQWWRFDQTRRLVAHLDRAPEQPRIVLGDLNSTRGWPAYERLARRLPDAVLAHARRSGGRTAGTFPSWLGARRLRIDHCFAHGLTAQACEVVDLPGSDHCGVLVEFGLD